MPVSLLHPGLFAIGLACVSIPIILHLLKRRRRVVSWGAMRFLEEAYRKRRRIITLEQLILLSLRCLLLVLIALGVGSLMLGSGGRGNQATTLVIVLDDSIGSALQIDGQTVLDRSKRFAIEGIESLDASRGDRVALISASSPARALVMPPSNDLGSVMALIGRATPSDAGLDLDGAVRVIGEQDDGEASALRRRELMLASGTRSLDRAMRAMDERPEPVAFDALRLLGPAGAVAGNTGVLGVRPTRALVVRDGLALPEAVRVELVRSGDTLPEQTQRVRVLDSEDAERGVGIVSWQQGQREASLSVAVRTEGLPTHRGLDAVLRVMLDDDANPRDNTGLLAIPVRNTLRVGVLDRPAPRGLGTAGGIAPARWVRAAMAPSEGMGVRVTSVDAQQAGSRLTPNFDALVVLAPTAINAEGWDRIARLHEQGTMLIVTPDAQNDSLAWFERVREMAPEVFAPGERLATHEPALGIGDRVETGSLLSGIAGELPMLTGAVQVHRSLRLPQGGVPIASLADGSALGVQVIPRDGSGAIVVLATPLDLNWTNLPARPLFVAMMQELVRQGVGIGSTPEPVRAGTAMPAPAWVQSSQPIDLPGFSRVADQFHEPSQLAGVIALRDAQGVARALRVVRPDSAGAIADPVERASIESGMGELVSVDSVRWSDQAAPGVSAGDGRVSSSDPRSLALWMLWAALAVATIEFLLARLFTARLVAKERVMGAMNLGGSRHE